MNTVAIIRHGIIVATALLALGLFFRARSLENEADRLGDLRERGSFVLANVTGSRVSTTQSPFSGIRPYYLKINFELRNGARFKGEKQVSEETWRLNKHGHPTRPATALVAVSPTNPENWEVHRDALDRQRAANWGALTAYIQAWTLLGLAVFAIVARPAIDLIDRRWREAFDRRHGRFRKGRKLGVA